MRWASRLLGAALALSLACGDVPRVRPGSRVVLEYTLTLEDGRVVYSTEQSGLARFTVGEDAMLPALERELLGQTASENLKRVVIPSDQAFGSRDPNMLKRLPLDQVDEADLAPGRTVVATDSKGNEVQVRVHEVLEDAVVFDFNHPLADETLHFEYRLLEVSDPQ